MNEGYLKDIPIGKENTVSKRALCMRWACSERTVERRIKELRRDNNDDYQIIGILVKGQRHFYRTNDKQELQDFYNSTVKLGKSIMTPCPKTRRILSDYRDADMRNLHLENNIKLLRERKGLKQTELAALTGIQWLDAPLLSKMENGVVKAVPAAEYALCRALDCAPEELYPTEESAV